METTPVTDDRDQGHAPEELLPLTPVAFEILISLAEDDRHGYAVMRDIEERSGGAVSLHAGTLYRALGRLVDRGLIAELEERPDPEEEDGRRRYYRLTAMGRRVAAAEATRLASQVDHARARRLLPEPGSG